MKKYLPLLVLLSGCANSGADDLDGGWEEDAHLSPDAPSACDKLVCSTDQQCQNICSPAPSGGTFCCDLATEKCYPYQSMTCPSPVPDAGYD